MKNLVFPGVLDARVAEEQEEKTGRQSVSVLLSFFWGWHSVLVSHLPKGVQQGVTLIEGLSCNTLSLMQNPSTLESNSDRVDTTDPVRARSMVLSVCHIWTAG